MTCILSNMPAQRASNTAPTQLLAPSKWRVVQALQTASDDQPRPRRPRAGGAARRRPSTAAAQAIPPMGARCRAPRVARLEAGSAGGRSLGLAGAERPRRPAAPGADGVLLDSALLHAPPRRRRGGSRQGARALAARPQRAGCHSPPRARTSRQPRARRRHRRRPGRVVSALRCAGRPCRRARPVVAGGAAAPALGPRGARGEGETHAGRGRVRTAGGGGGGAGECIGVLGPYRRSIGPRPAWWCARPTSPPSGCSLWWTTPSRTASRRSASGATTASATL